jgi:tetratricopeptide (TPR) repeat protein
VDALAVADRHFRVGQVYFASGNYVSAIKELDYAIVAFEQGGNLTGKADSLNTIGLSYVNLGRVDIATKYFSDSLAIRMKLGDKRLIAQVGLSLGASWVDLGMYAQARDLLEGVAALFQQLGDPAGEAAAWQNIRNCG